MIIIRAWNGGDGALNDHGQWHIALLDPFSQSSAVVYVSPYSTFTHASTPIHTYAHTHTATIVFDDVCIYVISS